MPGTAALASVVFPHVLPHKPPNVVRQAHSCNITRKKEKEKGKEKKARMLVLHPPTAGAGMGGMQGHPFIVKQLVTGGEPEETFYRATSR